jgi:hypothetical protein
MTFHEKWHIYICRLYYNLHQIMDGLVTVALFDYELPRERDSKFNTSTKSEGRISG